MSVIFIFFCVIFVTSILFGGWLIITVARFIARTLAGISGSGMRGNSAQCCVNPACRTINPTHANYCRRCGSNLANIKNNPRTAAMRPPRYDPATGNGRQVAV
jgi:hypothetical protein